MNLKTTLALLLVAVAGGVLWWFGATLPVSLSVAPTPQTVPASETVRILAEEITDDKLTRIEVQQGDQVLILQKENGVWTLPGKWPTRTAEVKQLVALLTGLESRFASVPLADDAELSLYGLDKPGVTVVVQADGKTYRLAFGEGKDDTASRFARPTWLQIVEPKQEEVVRLTPGLVAALDKPADYYQQRRLFPGERIAKENEPGEKDERLIAKSLSVEQKKEDGVRYTLSRNGNDWELSQPVRDRVDPDKLKSILTAIPDVWAESFVRDPKKNDPTVTGLDKPEEELQVTLPNGTTMTLQIGKVSQTKTRTVTRPSPPGMPLPPQKETVHEDYRYAKLKDNDQVFEIKADSLKEIFPTVDALRDAKLARFRTDDALRVEIAKPGRPTIVLTKDREKNRWSIAEPIQADAETMKITDLLDKLSGMQARDKDVLDNADPKKHGLETPIQVTVKTEEEVKDGETKKKVEKTFTFEIGSHDDKESRLYVRMKGWDRVNAVEENVLPLVERPVLAYRGRRVLDFAISDVNAIKVKKTDETLSLTKKDDKWSLAEPVQAPADGDRIDALAGSLGNLEAVEYVSDAAKPGDLEPLYGLGTPAVTATLEFGEKDRPTKTLLIGKARDGKDEYFAKLADSDSVFAVKKDVYDNLAESSLAYRPLQLWNYPTEDLAELRVQKASDPEYTLTRKEGGWKLTAPYQANVTEALVTPMSEDLARAKADKVAAHTAKEAAEYGLDKPTVRVTVVPKKDGANKEMKDRVLLIGNAVKDMSGRYAKLDDADTIYIVPDKLFNAADRTALDLLDRNLIGLDREEIEKVRSKIGEEKLGLQKHKDGWQVVESPTKAFDADKVAVDALLNVWSNLRAEKFVAYAPKPDELAKFGLDKPAATVSVTFPNKDKEETHTLQIGKVVEGGKDRYARLDDRPEVAVLPARVTDRLTATYLDYVNRNLIDVDADAIVAVLRRGKDELELVKRDDGWHVVKPSELKADDRVVREVLGQLTGRATRVAAYPADDLKSFGLDKPDAVVTLRVKGADDKLTDQVLKIGKPVGEEGTAPLTGERFASVNDDKAVLVLSPPLAQGVLAGALGFRDRSLVKFADADRAVLERGDRKPVSFVRQDGTWKVTEPIQTDAEHTELENLINAVAELRVAEFVAEKPTDKKPYGLDKPTAHWRFQSGDRDVLNLLVGGKEKDGSRRYAALNGSDLVFLLDAGVSNKLLAEYRRRAVWQPSLDSAQVEEVRYTKGGNVFTYEKSGTEWKLVGKPEVKVNADALNDALAAIAGLKAERFVQDKDANFKLYGLEPPELMIEVSTANGKRTLQIGRPEGESKRYYARVLDKDRSDVFVISEADAAKIVREQPGGKSAP